jgi:type IV pilus assembly protein PilN
VIEVNLLPGGRKRQSRKRSFSTPSFSVKGLPSDGWVRAALLIGVVALGAIGYFWLSLRQQREEVQVAIEAAVQDSARFADLIERTRRLQARRDSIVERVSVIQEIDQNRYVWPHVMDEIARALPDYTWLTQLGEKGRNPLRIMLRGRAGNNFAVTVLMDQLESSDYFRDVKLISSEQSPQSIEGGGQQVVYAFELEMTFQQPPLESLQTVPLLGAESGAAGR